MVKARDIMKKHVITVDPSVTISDAAKIMTNNRIGSVVVVENGAPVRMITDDDIVGLIAMGGDPKTTRISDIKPSKGFITASPDEDILHITKTMIKNGIKRIPIIRDGKLEGIVSDKEILMISPELIEVLSERLKARVERVAQPDMEISGICEKCESYSEELKYFNGRWYCEDCREVGD